MGGKTTKGTKPNARPDPSRAHVQAGLGGHNGKGGRGKGRGYGVAPVETLSEADRARAVRTIRNLQDILDTQAARVAKAMRADLDRGPDAKPYRLDVYESQAALSYAKAIAEVLAAHPGLLELANGDGGLGDSGEIGGEAAEDRLRAALRSG